MAVERTYVGPDRRYVPDLGVFVLPGDVVKFDDPPPDDDALFVTAANAKKVPDLKQWRTAAEAAPAAEPNPPEPAPESPADIEENS